MTVPEILPHGSLIILVKTLQSPCGNYGFGLKSDEPGSTLWYLFTCLCNCIQLHFAHFNRGSHQKKKKKKKTSICSILGKIENSLISGCQVKMMKCALHSFESVEIVSDLNVGLKVGSQVIALGLNKEDLGSYSRQELHNRFFFFQLVFCLTVHGR